MIAKLNEDMHRLGKALEDRESELRQQEDVKQEIRLAFEAQVPVYY